MIDNWANHKTLRCDTCMWYMEKNPNIGRCRRNAPTMDGFPVVYPSDWCGQHKMKTPNIIEGVIARQV